MGVPLWSSPPLQAISDIAYPVSTHDELKGRLASLAALFDHFNKRDFDQKMGATTEGTRKSFVAILKFSCPDQQPQIEQHVEDPLRFIALLRDYLLHTKNRNYKRAFEFFDLTDPISDPTLAWSRVLFSFSECLDRIREILAARQMPRLTPQWILDGPLREVVQLVLQEKRHVLGEARVAALLREIAARMTVRDTELAEIFSLDAAELRALLLPLTDSIILVRPCDRTSTILEVTPEIASLLRSGGSVVTMDPDES